MAIHHFYLKEPTACAVGMSTHLKFDGENVVVTWKRGNPVSMKAKIGDMIFVNCWGGVPKVGKTKPPKHLDRLALWLVGIPEKINNKDKFNQMYDELVRNEILSPWALESTEIRKVNGDKWVVAQKRNHFTGYGWKNLFGWVSQDISKEDIREMVEKVGPRWPAEYVHSCLKEVK